MRYRLRTRLAILLGLTIANGYWLHQLDHAPKNSVARAVASEADTDLAFLRDFNYRLTNIPTMEEAERIYASLETELTSNFGLECGSRAHVWSWQMKKNFNIQSGKIFLYYTPKSFNYTRMLWGMHVVPYVIVDGKEYVMEKAKKYVVNPGGGFYLTNDLLFPKPMLLSEWLKALTGFDSCNELDHSEPADRTWLAHFKNVRVIPDPNANCHIRKTPMDYWWGTSVYNHTFNGFVAPPIRQADVMASCLKSMAGRRERDRAPRCSSIL